MFTEIWKTLRVILESEEVSVGLILSLMSASRVELTEIYNLLCE